MKLPDKIFTVFICVLFVGLVFAMAHSCAKQNEVQWYDTSLYTVGTNDVVQPVAIQIGLAKDGTVHWRHAEEP